MHKDALTFQAMILALEHYWAGCGLSLIHI